MLDLEIVNYMKRPMSLLYKEGSGIGSPSMRVNFRLSSMGRLVGLQIKKPLSSNKAKVYFL